jgi:tRNA dimethylallyltransferase
MERQALYRRIDERVDRMIAEGFIAEVKGLLERGYALDLPAMSSLGYREIGTYLLGKMSLADAVQRIKFETHRFARYQSTWFRPKDPRIHWLRVEEGVERAAEELIGRWVHSDPLTGIPSER